MGERHQSVCAIIVTFNPPPSLNINVAALRDQVGAVIIVDNGSSAECRSTLERVHELPGVELVRNGTNAGIGAALNSGVVRASERGFPWVLTLDQDSLVGPDFVAELLHCYAERRDRDTIALIAPQYREQISGVTHDDWRRDVRGSDFLTTSMMSGNLVRTELIGRVGFYDETFFIDYVDHDFCLRLSRHGYRILKCKRAVLQHNLGRMSHRRVAGRVLATTNHSAVRRYYNARNRVIVYRRHWRVAPGWVARDIKSFVVETAKILLLEQERRAKLASVARGVWHGLTGRAL